MSYRGVKRVLGETRLELKCLVLFAICLLTLIGGSFWWYGSRTEDLVIDNARSTGRNLVQAALLHQHMQFLDDPKYQGMYASLGQNFQTQNYTYGFLKPDSTKPKFQPQDENEASILQHFPLTVPVVAKSPEATPKIVDTNEETQYVDRLLPDEKGEYQYQYFQPVY